MALWIMAFGGTVAIGGLIAGPLIEATSVTAVMLLGAVVAAAAGAVHRPLGPRAGRTRHVSAGRQTVAPIS